jgi:hypothetical protein
MVTPKGACQQRDRHFKFLSYLTDTRYVHPWWVPDKRSSHNLDSLGRWPRLACPLHSARAATLLEFHVPLKNCFTRRWFCVVYCPEPLLHRHNWLSFGKLQDIEHSLMPCPPYVSSRLPPSSKTCKYATARSTQKKTCRDSLPNDRLLSAVFVLVVAQPSSEIPEGLMCYPVQAK